MVSLLSVISQLIDVLLTIGRGSGVSHSDTIFEDLSVTEDAKSLHFLASFVAFIGLLNLHSTLAKIMERALWKLCISNKVNSKA